jgi:lipoate-protein ligase A
MLCFDNPSTNPYFNLACEEYLLKNVDDEVFMLWRNEPAIIVGKHQNTLAEINTEYVKDQGIKVVRRLTGGGAVFHDLGNLNFTFIKFIPLNGDQIIDFQKHTKPILDILLNLGINAKFEGRNDLTIDGKKFSGNAEHVHKHKVLHHGTLLFSAKLPDLSAALKVDPLKFEDKAVKSVRSRVTNISEHLEQPLSVEEFKDMVMQHIIKMYPDSKPFKLDKAAIDEVEALVEKKYDTWEWNFGQSPVYNLRKGYKAAGGFIEFDLFVEKGIIKELKIFGDFFNKSDIEEIENALKGLAHEEAIIKEKLSMFDINAYFNNFTLDDLLKAIF